MNHKLNIKVPASVVRATAFFVFITSVMAVLSGLKILIAVLVYDFMVRALGRSRLSLFAYMARKILVPYLTFITGYNSQSSKRFAAAIGFILSFAAMIFNFTGLNTTAIGLLTVLSFFSFLESVFGFCVGCQVYILLVKYHLIQDDTCEECEVDFRKHDAA
jgi:hypothetical protein